MDTLTICLIICALTVLGFIWGKWSMATVSLLSFFLFIITGCVDTDPGSRANVYLNFGNNNALILMSMFVVAAGFRKTQFVHKVSASVNKFAKGNLTKTMAAYVLITILLSQFIQSPVVVFGIMSPMLAATCAEMNVSPSKVMYALGIAAIATCSAFPLGSGATVNAELNNYIKIADYTQYLDAINVTDPMKARLPLVIVCAVYCIFFAPKFAPDAPILLSGKSAEQRGGREQKALAPFQEKSGYLIFIGVTLALIFQKQLFAALPSTLHLEGWMICFLGALLMVMTGVLSPREAVDAMPLWMYFLLVGSLTMGSALTYTGAGNVIGDALAGLVQGINSPYIIGFIFFLIPFLLTQFMSNRTVIQIFCPLAALTCKSLGANPIGIVILVQAACLTAFITPMATPAVPQYMAAGGYDLKSVLKQSIIPCVLFCAVSVFWTMTVMPMY